MDIEKSVIIGKIRTAIDDIAPSVTDSFTDDTNTELWQATWHAVQVLLLELPLDMLEPSAMEDLSATENDDGSGSIDLSDDFLRFVSLQLRTWLRPVTELMEPGSNEALSQTSKWSRGTPEKPRAMIDYDDDGNQILRYWTAGKVNGTYDHTISILNYIPMAEQVSTQQEGQVTPAVPYITCVLKDTAEPLVINRAAAIFFEGKKEPETAEKFRNM